MNVNSIHPIALLGILILAGCADPGDRVEITETKTRSDYSPVNRVNATSEERFAAALPDTAAQSQLPPVAQASAQSGAESPFTFTVPEGWTQLAPTQFRNPNFIAGADGEIECYVSTLPGDAGGLLVNANRWRGQMGQEPYTPEEFATLPRAILMGGEAVILDFDGTFTGMGQAPKTGYHLIGALIAMPDQAVFIKMTGPVEALTPEQKNNFAFFAQSLRPAGAEAEAEEAAASAQPDPAPTADIQSENDTFAWDVPEGWNTVAHSSPMRMVTFSFGAQNEGECYVVVLPGEGGGRLDNMNRWLAQMGQAPLEETELMLQPTVFLFEGEVPMLVTPGTYTGMGGGQPLPNHQLIGVTGEIEGQSLFIKLVAPEALANANLNKFMRFCASIHLK